MVHNHNTHVSDEERRSFLKALGVAGTVAAGGATLQEVRDATTAGTASEIEPVTEAVTADVGAELDAELIASQQAELAEAAAAMPSLLESGIGAEPGNEFVAVQEAGQPVYDHLVDVGFFESTTEHLPEFTPEYLETAASAFVGSEALAEPLADLGLTDGEGVDLLTTVIANAEELSDYHWIATDEINRSEVVGGEFLPPMTMGAAGGALLWLKDLDTRLWQTEVLLADGMLEQAVWHGQSMAAGLQLMNEGAHAIATGGSGYGERELTALLATGFAVQTISQNLLPEDVYWITEEMRGPRRTDLKMADI